MTNLLGLHVAEPGAGHVYPEWDGGDPGWRVWVRAVGTDPGDHSGDDFTLWQEAGFKTVVRLGVDWAGGGCIPTPDLYPEFAQRCANYVAASTGIDYVIIGNEPNHSQEWPQGQPIDSGDYVDAYDMAYDAIKAVKSSVAIAIAAIAPYNAECGDWLAYYQDVVDSVYRYDAIAIHAYSRGQEPEAITDPAKMSPPYEDHYSGFQVYREWIEFGIGPYLLTEFNPLNDPAGWRDRSTHLIWEALTEIDGWNADYPGKPILCVCCYRSAADRWRMHDKPNIILDYQTAAAKGFVSPIDIDNGEEPPQEEPMVELRDGFESGFYAYNGIGELTCPNGWEPQWIDDPQPGVLDRPEYKPAGEAQVRTGNGAVAIHSRYNTIDGVLAQAFEVANGGVATASVYCMKTEDAMGHGMRVGIDPTGGNDHTSTAVVWSDWYSQYSEDYAVGAWRLRTASTTAQSNIVTVYLRSKLDNAADGSHAHFDDFVLAYEGESPPSPSPQPPVSGSHVLRVYLDDVLISEEPFTAEAAGIVFKKAT